MDEIKHRAGNIAVAGARALEPGRQQYPRGRRWTPDEIQAEADRLSVAAGWPGGPARGWQYPFDLGHGIVTDTYTPIQSVIHPYRRRLMLAGLDRCFPDRAAYETLSVLDLGACEGSMAFGLWERGVRDITCVDVRETNCLKGAFVASVLGADINFIQQDIADYLAGIGERKFDIVLVMSALCLILDPFTIMRQAANVTRRVAVVESEIAIHQPIMFTNNPNYAPSEAGFFLRADTGVTSTGGILPMGLWPNRAGLDLLLTHSGYRDITPLEGEEPLPPYYDTGERVMVLAWK